MSLIIVAAALFAIALALTRRGALLWIVIPALAFLFVIVTLRTDRRASTLQAEAAREAAAREVAAAREAAAEVLLAPDAPRPPGTPLAPTPEFWLGGTEPVAIHDDSLDRMPPSSRTLLRPVIRRDPDLRRQFEIDGEVVLKRGEQAEVQTRVHQEIRASLRDQLAGYFEQLAQDPTPLPRELAEVREELRQLSRPERAQAARDLARRIKVETTAAPATTGGTEDGAQRYEFRSAVSPRTVLQHLDAAGEDGGPPAFLLTAGALVAAALVLKATTRQHGPTRA